MRRLLFSFVLVSLWLAVPTAALAALLPPPSTTVTGTLASTGSYSFTVQTAGRATGVLGALTSAANKVTDEDYPYVWGGGHGEAGIASVGMKGPGYNGKRRGFDCSGSVAAVLASAGLWPVGSGVPSDAGVILYLRQHHEIAAGAGTGPREVTLYDDPGVHIFMNIDGRFFGTSDGGGGGDSNGGPGWLDDAAWDAHSGRFHRYHVLPSMLKATTSAGYTLGFQYGTAFQYGPGASLASVPLGAKVKVVYKTTNQGTMVAQSVSLVGETTVTGVVQPLAASGRSASIKTASGRRVTFPVTAGSGFAEALLNGQIAPGDTVSVAYIKQPAVTVISFTVTSIPTPTTTTPTTTTPTTTTPTITAPTTTVPTTTTPTTTASTGYGGQSGNGWSGGQGF